MYMTAYFAVLELTTARWRVLNASATFYFWLFGYAALPAFAYFVRSWRALIWVSTGLIVPYVVLLL